jgi:hypothetical protein
MSLRLELPRAIKQTHNLLVSFAPKQSARRRQHGGWVTRGLRSCPCACSHGFQFPPPPRTAGRDAEPRPRGRCGPTSDNMHEKYQYHRCFLAFSPRLSPQLPMPSVAVLLSLLSVQLSPIDFAPTPLQSRTHQRGKKGLVFSSEKGERENYTPPLSTVQPRTPRQAGGQGRQEASSAKALRETAEPAAHCATLGRRARRRRGRLGSWRLWTAVAAACFVWWRCAHWRAGSLGPARRDLARAADAARVGRPGS